MDGLKGQGGRPVGPRRDGLKGYDEVWLVGGLKGHGEVKYVGGLKGLHNLSPGHRPGNMAKEHPQA